MAQTDAQLITLSTGVVLRRTQPSAWALTEVDRQMQSTRPQPPLIDNPDRGRAEPNEADPDYQDDLLGWEMLVIERRYQFAIATGTAIERIPEDVLPLESDDWIEALAAIGLPCPPNMTKTERYLLWLKYVAAPANTDWIALYTPLSRYLGTPEEDVAAATEMFRGDPERRVDYQRADQWRRGDGYRHGRDLAGAGTALRGARGRGLRALLLAGVAHLRTGGTCLRGGTVPDALLNCFTPERCHEDGNRATAAAQRVA